MADDLSKLTDEELLALAGDSPSESSTGLESLSDEELLALSKEIDPDPIPAPPSDQDISDAEVLVRGGASGVTLGFSDEIEAGAKAALRFADQENAEWGDIYNQELDKAREANVRAKEANEALFTGAEIGGGLATAFVPGAAGLRGAMILSGTAGVGFSEAKKGSELIKDFAQGATVGLITDRFMKGAGARLARINKASQPATVRAVAELGESTIPEAVELESNLLKTAFKERHGSWDAAMGSKELLLEASKSMEKLPTSMKDLVDGELNAVGREFEKRMSLLGQDANIDITPLLGRLDESFKKTLSTTDLPAKSKFENLILKDLKEGKFQLKGETVNPASMSPKQLVDLKREMNEVLIKKFDDGAESIFKQSKAVDRNVKQFTSQLTDHVNQLPGLGELNSQFSKLYNVKALLPDSRVELAALPNIFDKSARGEKAFDLMMAMNDYSPEFAARFKGFYNPVINIFNAASAARDFNVSVSTMFQAKAAKAATEQAGLGPVGALFALGQGGSLMGADIAGKAVRKITKIPRTIAGVIDNQEDVVAAVSKVSLPIAIQLNNAIDDRDLDSIRDILSSGAENFPEEFEAGVGIDGRITGEREATILKQQARNLPVIDRMKANASINAGIVPAQPQPKPPVERKFPFRRRDSDGRKI